MAGLAGRRTPPDIFSRISFSSFSSSAVQVALAYFFFSSSSSLSSAGGVVLDRLGVLEAAELLPGPGSPANHGLAGQQLVDPDAQLVEFLAGDRLDQLDDFHLHSAAGDVRLLDARQELPGNHGFERGPLLTAGRIDVTDVQIALLRSDARRADQQNGQGHGGTPS